MVKKQNVLALDLASTTGWATKTRRTDHIQSGEICWVSKSKKVVYTKPRICRFKGWLEYQVSYWKIKKVVYEAPLPGAYGSALLIQMETVIILVCEERDIDYDSVNVGTLKKATTGDGRASKAMMIAAVEVLFADHIKVLDEKITHNQADALAVLAWEMGQ